MRCFLLTLSFALIFAAVNCEEAKKEEVEAASKERTFGHMGGMGGYYPNNNNQYYPNNGFHPNNQYYPGNQHYPGNQYYPGNNYYPGQYPQHYPQHGGHYPHHGGHHRPGHHSSSSSEETHHHHYYPGNQYPYQQYPGMYRTGGKPTDARKLAKSAENKA